MLLAPEGAPDGADPIASHIARAIEGDIVFGRLRPGQKLPEEELAERFSASRHQVREGLARLERIGIVTRERNRGASVRSFTAEEVRQIYEVRELLQRQAALRIPLPVDEAGIASLRTVHEEYERAAEAGDLQRTHPPNHLVHTQLFPLPRNQALGQLVKHHMDLTYPIPPASFA